MALPGSWRGHGGRKRSGDAVAGSSAHTRPSWGGLGGAAHAARIDNPTGLGPSARAPALWDARLRASRLALRRFPRPRPGHPTAGTAMPCAVGALARSLHELAGAACQKNGGDGTGLVANSRGMPPRKCRVIPLPVMPRRIPERVVELSPEDAEKVERFRCAVTRHMLRNGTARARLVKG